MARIAIDIDGQLRPNPSGIHHYLDGLLDGLVALEQPHELTALAPAASSPAAVRAYAGDGLFAWTRSPRARIDIAGGRFPLRFRTLPFRLGAASARYDLLHLPNAECRGAERARSDALVATIYDLSPRLVPDMHVPANVALWEKYFAFARDRCDRVLTISQAARRDIVEQLAIPDDRIDVTPLAPRAAATRVTDPDALGAALAPLGLEHARFLLYVGALEPRKNLPSLVRAFAAVTAAPGLGDTRLVLAGGAWGAHDRELRELAAELGVRDRLDLVGHVSSAAITAMMSGCAAFAYVSLYEGFGLPPLEAMACGAPVVTSNSSSLPEVVGDAGIQVAPDDVDALAAALSSLLEDEVENARRRDASLARAALFSWERTARLTLNSYEAALA